MDRTFANLLDANVVRESADQLTMKHNLRRVNDTDMNVISLRDATHLHNDIETLATHRKVNPNDESFSEQVGQARVAQFVVLCQQSGLKDRIINTDLRLDGLERWRRQVENRLGVLGGAIDDQAGVPPQDLDAFVVVDHGGDAFFDDEDYNIPRIVEAEVNEVPLAGGDANAPPGPLFHFHEAPPPAAAPQQPLDGEALAGQMKHFTEQLVQALRQDMRQGFAGVRETLDRHTMTLDRHTATLDLHAVTLANISEASRKRERAPNSTISFCHIAPATTSPHPLWSRAPSQTPLVHKT
jgi:hypothetical protein